MVGEEELFSIAPPLALLLSFEIKAQFKIIGDEDERLHIAAPSPVFELKVQFKIVGCEELVLSIPPPLLLAIFDSNVQFEIVGEAAAIFHIPPPEVPLFDLKVQFEMTKEEVVA